jgi:hypothetical protein
LLRYSLSQACDKLHSLSQLRAPFLIFGGHRYACSGNGRSLVCVVYNTVASGMLCADRNAVVRVFSDCWASSTFALGFHVRLLKAAGGVRGGVANTRSGVDVGIRALARCLVGR